MTVENSITIKRSITIRAVVTPSWKEEAEREISSAIATSDQQLAQLEKEEKEKNMTEEESESVETQKSKE